VTRARQANIASRGEAAAARVAALEARIGHVFADRALLMRALTHKSAGDGVRGFLHNERLEWLGDRVLGLLAAERLHAGRPKDEEGELTRRFNQIVSGANCAQAGEALGLGDIVAISRSLGGGEGVGMASVLADAFEALLGALYLDGGLDAARPCFEVAWEVALDGGPGGLDLAARHNPKSALQEWAQKRGLAGPVYEVIARDGPDHAPRFVVACAVAGRVVEAEGGSKQSAERAAALSWLETRDEGGQNGGVQRHE
jgi:ribonuclease III